MVYRVWEPRRADDTTRGEVNAPCASPRHEQMLFRRYFRNKCCFEERGPKRARSASRRGRLRPLAGRTRAATTNDQPHVLIGQLNIKGTYHN